jgi:hypothetical protein
MQVIGLFELFNLADKRPDLAPVLGALATRLRHLNAHDAQTLAASFGVKAEGDQVDLCLARSDVRITMRCDDAAGVILILKVTIKGVS